jgi:hypothetical protein
MAGALVRRAKAIGIGVGGAALVAAAIATIGRIDTTASQTSAAAASAAAPAPLEWIDFKLNSDPWATIEVDGVRVGSTPITIRMTPGAHHFHARMADGRIAERSLMVSRQWDHYAFR